MKFGFFPFLFGGPGISQIDYMGSWEIRLDSVIEKSIKNNNNNNNKQINNQTNNNVPWKNQHDNQEYEKKNNQDKNHMWNEHHVSFFAILKQNKNKRK